MDTRRARAFLREFLYDGFNADEQGQIVFDGLLLAAGGAGRGSFNHRFADPGIAGNSTDGIDEPVDLFPFTDADQADAILHRTDGLLRRAAQQHAIPKMFHLSSATEYWARAASLLHTSVDGKNDIALPANSRYYFFPGTPHSPAAFPPARQTRAAEFTYAMNPFDMRIAFPALLIAMQSWLVDGTQPPLSRYPTVSTGELVAPDKLTAVPEIVWPTFIPEVTRLFFGHDFARTGVITKHPPERGAAYSLLVPQVDADGNEIAGVRLPHVAVPLGAVTGWNQRQPPMTPFNRLAGLTGSYVPFAWTKVHQRYGSKEAYLEKIRASAEALVKARFLLPEAVQACVDRAAREWDWRAASH